MSQQPVEILERLLRDNGLGWMWGPHRDQVVPAFVEQLNKVSIEYRNRIQQDVSFSPEVLETEAARNPHKVRAFLQAFAAPCSTHMLVMVWRILQGLKIWGITMTYTEEKEFSLTVTLARPENGQDTPEVYQSENIFDAILLRHLGVCETNDGPLFLGFNALRLGSDQR
jgi:hypothetical protein